MNKFKLLCACALACAFTSFAQETTLETSNKKVNHTVGIQINELIRQVFNFNNSAASPTLNNPYLLTYNINSATSGWGGRLGFGYTYRNFTDDDGITRRETDVNNLQLRIGAEKATQLSGRWSLGAGADFLYNTDYSNTNTVTRTFDTVTTVVKSDVTRIGGGVMSWLRYSVNKNILIGTEASFYYLSGDLDQRITITQRDFNQPGQPKRTTTTRTNNKDALGSIRLPVAFYLLVKF